MAKFLTSFICTILVSNFLSAQQLRVGLGFQVLQNSIESKEPAYSAPEFGSPLIMASYILDSGDAALASISYQNKQYVSNSDSALLVEMRPRVNFKLGFEKWFYRFGFGLALGSTYPVGKKRSVSEIGGDTSDLATSARDITNYMMELHMVARIWQEKESSIRLEYGKAFLITPSKSEDSDHVFTTLVYEIKL